MTQLEYGPLLIYMSTALLISTLIVVASYVLGVKKPDTEKSNVYECGFSPYSDTRSQFEVRFFLVAILFIIFDLEISFLFPWSTVLNKMEEVVLGYWMMNIFLIILTIGLVYEWLKGGLEWE